MISLLFPCLFLIYLLILFVAAVIIESETTWDKRDFERSQSGSTSWALSWKIALSLNFAKVKSPFALLFIYMRHRASLHFFDLLLHPLPCSFSVQPNALYCLYVHSFKFGYFFLNFYNAKTPGKTMTFLSTKLCDLARYLPPLIPFFIPFQNHVCCYLFVYADN